MRIHIKQARPVDLNDAICHAVELDAFNSAERHYVEDMGYLKEASQPLKADNDTVSSLLKLVRNMLEDMKSIKWAVANSKSTKRQRAITFNFYKKKGHVKKDCYSYQIGCNARAGKQYGRPTLLLSLSQAETKC